LQHESGPFHIFDKLRKMAGLTNVSDLPLNEQLLYSDKEFIHNGNIFAEILECIWCLSVWLGFLVAVYLGITKSIKRSLIPLYAFAISALTILIDTKGMFNDK